jgi:hypothetical protein
MPLKVNFVPLTPILSAEINQNFLILRDRIMKNDDLTSQIDGVALLFTTTYPFVLNSTDVFVDGIKQRLGTDYTESGSQIITFTSTLVVGQDLVINYLRNDL